MVSRTRVVKIWNSLALGLLGIPIRISFALRRIALRRPTPLVRDVFELGSLLIVPYIPGGGVFRGY